MHQSTRKAIVGGTIFTPGGAVSPGALLVVDGVMVAAGRVGDVAVPSDAAVVDATGSYVVPGLIDLHLHGQLGHDVMGAGLAEVIRALPAYGVTGFLATTITQPRDLTLGALKAMAQLLRAPPAGARCLGIHLEGPFLAPSRAGMARAEWFEPLTWERVEVYLRAAAGQIRMVTLAPELPGAMACIPRLAEAGVIPSIGHSDASFKQVLEAVGSGLRHATHTFNAMRPLHHRNPGVVGAVMHADALIADVIADGIHIHPAVVGLLLRIKGSERVALVSDAAPQAGLPDGMYGWGGQRIRVADGACRLEDGTISGAHALLDTGLRTLVLGLGLPLSAALLSAASVPASELGLRAGRLEPGYDADLVMLDEQLRPVRTFVSGVEVFRRHNGSK